MSQLDYPASILLGIIQGLTEFLPISSSGHLALTQRWLGLEAHTPTMLLFDVCVHVGTLVAVGVVFAKSIASFLGRLLRELNRSWNRPRYALRIAGLAIAASVPTGVIGLSFQDKFESAFGRPKWIGAALIVTGILLILTLLVRRPNRGWRRFLWWQAAIVGTAQACAIFPGISRSGSTICAALFCGLRRRWAAEFSFLIAAPAIAGATLLKIRDTRALPAEQFDTIPWGPVITGSAVSLAVGVLALLVLLHAVRRAKLHYFAPYCVVLGALIIGGVLSFGP